jgi:hypothetical protein
VLDKHSALVGEDAQHTARLAAVGAPEDLDRIVAMNIQTRHLFSKYRGQGSGARDQKCAALTDFSAKLKLSPAAMPENLDRKPNPVDRLLVTGQGSLIPDP